MKTKIYSLMLTCLLAISPVSDACAQTLSSQVNNVAPQTVTVIFTFQAAFGDYTTFYDEGRYYIQVPAGSIPSYKFAGASAGVKVMVDNDRSNENSLVFFVPVQPGTFPRLERKDANLMLTFIAPLNSAMTGTRNMGTAEGQATNSLASAVPEQVETPVASPASQPTPANSLMPLLPFQPDPNSLLLANAEVDLAVPESPAFTVLGITPQTVVRPSSPRQFASSLLSGIDQRGNFQSGLALDAVPYWIFAGSGITLREYQNSYKIRLLSRTQFSFGNTKGASADDKSVKLALGLRITLWDTGDPHLDKELLNCFAERIKLPGPPRFPPPADDASPAEKQIYEVSLAAYETESSMLTLKNKEAEEQCRVESRKRNWNKSSWAIGLAPSWISTTGESKNFKWNGGGFWTSVAYGFGGIPKLRDNSQLLLHARYRNNEQVPDEDNSGQFLSQDSFFFGGRWRYGNPDTSANFESVYQRTRFKGQAWDNSARYSLGLERKIAENLWFALAFGGERGRENGMNDGFILTSFRWGFSQKRTIPGLNPSPTAGP